MPAAAAAIDGRVQPSAARLSLKRTHAVVARSRRCAKSASVRPARVTVFLDRLRENDRTAAAVPSRPAQERPRLSFHSLPRAISSPLDIPARASCARTAASRKDRRRAERFGRRLRARIDGSGPRDLGLLFECGRVLLFFKGVVDFWLKLSFQLANGSDSRFLNEGVYTYIHGCKCLIQLLI